MAVRIRKDGRILCAAMHPAEDGDCYVNDSVHYALSVEAKVMVTEPHERHKDRGEWWWINAIPSDVDIDPFYIRGDLPAQVDATDYTIRTDGEGFEVPSGERYRLACCDCGLVHDIMLVSHDGLPIGMAATVNPEETASRRKSIG